MSLCSLQKKPKGFKEKCPKAIIASRFQGFKKVLKVGAFEFLAFMNMLIDHKKDPWLEN
jgi:hypothetical protein